MEKETKFQILAALFVAFIIMAATAGAKIGIIFGLTMAIGAIPSAFSYIITDVTSEVWGKKRTKALVFAGLISWLSIAGMILLFIVIPSAPFWEQHQESYAAIFGTSVRLFIAGTIGYVLSQYHDIWAFCWWKEKTKGKHLWLRNNLSTIVSQFINTSVIVFVGFYGLIPSNILFMTFIGWYFFKLLIALGDTPIVYLLVYWIEEGPPKQRVMKGEERNNR